MTARVALAVALVGALAASAARAEEQPIDADLLQLRTSAEGTRFLFVSRDPSFPFPPTGAPFDGPSGFRVEIITTTQINVLFEPPGERWREVPAHVDRYSYSNPSAPTQDSKLRRAQIREGRLLRIRGIAPGLSLLAPIGPVAIRVEIGFETSCALFDAATIRRDEPGSFRAREATAAALPDCRPETITQALGIACGDPGDQSCGGACPGEGVCSYETFGGACRCVSPSDPCGGTAPICNGACPDGEECVAIGTGFPGGGCTCTPIGVTPCGASGFPACEAACPNGQACLPAAGKYGEFCACFAPGPCGGGGGECPSSFICHSDFIVGTTCRPVFCSGTFPACGGGCANGYDCKPFQIQGLDFGICACALAGSTCDGTSGGFGCPPGEVCTFTPTGEYRACLPL